MSAMFAGIAFTVVFSIPALPVSQTVCSLQQSGHIHGGAVFGFPARQTRSLDHSGGIACEQPITDRAV
jgi:hypothetical protein